MQYSNTGFIGGILRNIYVSTEPIEDDTVVTWQVFQPQFEACPGVDERIAKSCKKTYVDSVDCTDLCPEGAPAPCTFFVGVPGEYIFYSFFDFQPDLATCAALYPGWDQPNLLAGETLLVGCDWTNHWKYTELEVDSHERKYCFYPAIVGTCDDNM